MTPQPSLTDPPDNDAQPDFRSPEGREITARKVRDRELAEARRLLKAAGARGV